MRWATGLVVVLAALAAAPGPALADEPNYAAESLIFVQDDLRYGWEVIDAEDDLPESLPTEDQLTALAGEDGFELTVEYRLLRHESGAKAVVAIVDVDLDDPGPFRSALDAKAASCGWSVTELGHPKRLLVVAGRPEDVKALTKWQVERAAVTLCQMAYERLLQDHVGGQPGRLSRERATEFVDAAAKLVPGIGGAEVMHGLFKLYDGEFDDAFAILDAATKGGAPIAAPDGLVVFALALQGRAMLALERADLDVEVVDVLTRAVELQAVALADSDRLQQEVLRLLPYENRMNLARAYGRLEKPDEAFEQVESALQLGKKLLTADQYKGQFLLVWFWDPSFSTIRKDERFEEFANRFAPAGFDFLKEREAAEAEKARIEAAKEAEKEKKEGS